MHAVNTELAPHSSTLAWRIAWMEEPGRLHSMGSLSRTQLSDFTLDSIERLHFHFSLSCIEEGNGNPLRGSCLEHPRDRGAWWAAVYGVAQSWKRLKRLSSSSSSREYFNTQTWVSEFPCCYKEIFWGALSKRDHGYAKQMGRGRVTRQIVCLSLLQAICHYNILKLKSHLRYHSSTTYSFRHYSAHCIFFKKQTHLEEPLLGHLKRAFTEFGCMLGRASSVHK